MNHITFIINLLVHQITNKSKVVEVKNLKDNMHRLMLSIPEELHNKLDALKKEKFYNDTKAEMYRFLIKNGLEFVAKSQRT